MTSSLWINCQSGNVVQREWKILPIYKNVRHWWLDFFFFFKLISRAVYTCSLILYVNEWLSSISRWWETYESTPIFHCCLSYWEKRKHRHTNAGTFTFSSTNSFLHVLWWFNINHRWTVHLKYTVANFTSYETAFTLLMSLRRGNSVPFL